MQKEKIIVTDKNRDDIIRTYAYRLLDEMDNDSLYSFAYNCIVDSKDLMDNLALESEILDYYPDILDYNP